MTRAHAQEAGCRMPGRGRKSQLRSHAGAQATSTEARRRISLSRSPVPRASAMGVGFGFVLSMSSPAFQASLPAIVIGSRRRVWPRRHRRRVVAAVMPGAEVIVNTARQGPLPRPTSPLPSSRHRHASLPGSSAAISTPPQRCYRFRRAAKFSMRRRRRAYV